MVEGRTIVQLSDEQMYLFNCICHFIETGRGSLDPRFYVAHGLGGTGKTEVLAAVARKYPRLFLCTLTGKAASVLRRRTGIPATTIHSVFYRLVDVKKARSKSLLDAGREDLVFEEQFGQDALSGEILLLDESSMISERMANELLRTGVRIVCTGDPGQLPPIDGETFFCRPDYTLTEIHRQAWNSPIIRQAHMFRQTGYYQPDTDQFQVKRSISAEEIVAADMLICWKNATRFDLNVHKRRYLGLEGKHPQAGETLMCLKNKKVKDLDGIVLAELYNGATYTLLDQYDPFSHRMILDVDGKKVYVYNSCFVGLDDLAKRGNQDATPFYYGYAGTCHKMQGSEFVRTIVVDEYSRHDQRIRWGYTAITRAKESEIVLRAVSI